MITVDLLVTVISLLEIDRYYLRIVASSTMFNASFFFAIVKDAKFTFLKFGFGGFLLIGKITNQKLTYSQNLEPRKLLFIYVYYLLFLGIYYLIYEIFFKENNYISLQRLLP